MNFYKAWRVILNVSQMELSVKAGIPRYKIQNVESGLANYTTIESTSIFEYLGSVETKKIRNLKLVSDSMKKDGDSQ